MNLIFESNKYTNRDVLQFLSTPEKHFYHVKFGNLAHKNLVTNITMTKPSLLKQETLPETVGNNTYLQFSGYKVFNRVYLFSEITYFCIYTSVNDIKFRRLEESFPGLDLFCFVFGFFFRITCWGKKFFVIPKIFVKLGNI